MELDCSLAPTSCTLWMGGNHEKRRSRANWPQKLRKILRLNRRILYLLGYGDVDTGIESASDEAQAVLRPKS